MCSGRSTSLRKLLETLIALAGVEIEIRVDSERVRAVDMDELKGTHAKITKDTGWSPAIPLKETLQSLLDYWTASLSELDPLDETAPKGTL